MTMRARFAPSPTGYLHIGGARTALYSWLYARKHGGKFILRIEDTDRERSSTESVNAILEGMTWLGLEYDEGPFYQTDRFDRYKEVIQTLLDEGKAYKCYCSREELDALREQQMANKEKPRYNGLCRDGAEPREGIEPVIRFRNPPEGAVVIDDMIKGRVVIQNSELDDLIIARGDGSPTYNLTVVVDDLDMGITHVVRGDDHLNNTPRQINILQAMGAEPPRYAHVPMILGEDGKRLSKRHGAVSVISYRDQGLLPEALINYLVRLGWSHGDQEMFSLEELIELFDVADVNRAASTFNLDKLLWINQQYIINSEPEHVLHHLSFHLGNIDLDPTEGPDIIEVIKAQRERAKTLVELAKICEFYYRDFATFPEKAAKKAFKGDAGLILANIRGKLAALPEWNRGAIHGQMEAVVAEMEIGFGKIGMPLRLAVTGGNPSPDLDLTIELVGREATLRRIDQAIARINQ
ncbi:Glutamyl-tRNA synthetase [hydrothermal vent metagenome]|uniref:glutamate--tRNA ligase n=1 Tax=hydrothermal vent metagenome TaxID=652676 RepID=A0A3B0Z430_9ZZZZ